jgi:flavin-dependent dehydrogenase
MRIGVAGLGSSGSYLLHLLTKSGFDAVGFDPKRDGYYIPCGYAANRHRMSELLSPAGLNFSHYIESEAGSIIFSGSSMREIAFNSLGLVTFDKNRLERDLIENCTWKRESLNGTFDLLIDATGVSRSYLPGVKDYRMHTVEYLVSVEEKKEFQFRYFANGSGYFWIFPKGKRYHVGAGSDSIDKIRSSLSGYTPEKVVSRDIRLKPLFHSLSHGNVIGMGEAIGTVSPITGEGIVPSMTSARLLFDAIKRSDDIETVKENYAASIRKEFHRYYTLYELLRDFQAARVKKKSAISYLRAARKDLRGFGIDFRISHVIREFV